MCTGRVRWLLPSLLVVVWLGLGGGLGALSGKLGEVADSGSAAYLPADAEATLANDEAKAFGVTESLPAIVVYTRRPVLTEDDRAAIRQDGATVATEFGDALAGPPTEPRFSDGGSAAYVTVRFTGVEVDEHAERIDRLRDLVTAHQGLTAHVTGPAGMERDLSTAIAGIDLFLVLVTGAVILVILIVVYRSPLLPLLVLAIAGTGLGVAMGLIYLLARAGLLSMGAEVQGIFSVLVLGAGTDYALLLVSRYREELHRHADHYAAMRVAWRNSFGAIAASAGTVAAGLLCLLLSDLGLNRDLGPVGAIGIACAMLTMLTLLPAALVLLGRATFWPRRPDHRAPAVPRGGWWAKVAVQVDRRPRVLWLGTALLLAVLSLGALRLDASGLSMHDQLINDNVDSARGQAVLAEHFPAGEGNPVLIVANSGSGDAVAAAVSDVDGVAGVEIVPREVGGRIMLTATLEHAPDSDPAREDVRRIRAAAHQVPGSAALVGGYTAVQVDFHAAATRDRIILPLLLIVVLAMLILLLRALVAPLLLLATVLLSYLAAIGVSAFVFQDLLGLPGADSTYPVHTFVFLVALGVDYNIFLMTRAREEAVRWGSGQGMLRALIVTGGVITSAGVVLAATFSALALIPLVLLVELAFTVAFGVLLDTLVVRSLLVPALIVDCGRWAWWPWRPGPRAPGGQRPDPDGVVSHARVPA